MTILHNARRLARSFGLEVHRANPMTDWRCRLPQFLDRLEVGLVLDVGANDGGYAASLFDNGFRGDVLSFEPLPSAYARLVARAARHGSHRWRVAPRGALGSREGTVDLVEAGNSVSSSTLPMLASHVEAAPESAPVAVHRVPIGRLDDLIEADAPGMHLKIDVQGAELDVLEGARRALAGPIHSVQLEMSLAELYRGQPLAEDLHDFLTQHGFELWDIAPGFRNRSNLRLLQYDGFYVQRARIDNRTAGVTEP